MSGDKQESVPGRENDEIGIALVGYGYWGPNLARNVSATDGAHLAAICDLSEARRESAARQHVATRVTADWDSVLADDGISGVVVALPVALHHRFALEALNAGKHVLVEKPLAQSVAECDELIAAARSSQRTLMVGHTFEYNEAVRLIGRYIRDQELGELYYISMRRTNLGIVRTDENALWSLAPHDISILIHWIDRAPVSVNATGAAWLQPGIHDVVFVTVEFEGGVVGQIHCSWLDPNKIREATVVGGRKMAVYDDVSADMKVRLYDKGIVRQKMLGEYETFAGFQMLARAGDIVVPKVDFREPLAVEMAHFVECIESGSKPLSDGESGRRVVAVLDAAQRSLTANGAAESVVADAVL